LNIFFLCSCAPPPLRQDIRPHVVKPADQVHNSVTQNNISVGIEPYYYSGQGLNYLRAGIHPIQVIITNNSKKNIELKTDSVLAHSSNGNLYLTYTPQEASELVINSHAMEEAANGAASGAISGAAIGALVGLAMGVALHADPGRSAATGAIGGAVGGTAGGAQAWLARLRSATIAEINNKALRDSIIQPGFTKSGWLFFPGEVYLDELRVAISEESTENHIIFKLPIISPTP